MNVCYILSLRCFSCFYYISLIFLVYHSCVGHLGNDKNRFGLIWKCATGDVNVYINTDVII